MNNTNFSEMDQSNFVRNADSKLTIFSLFSKISFICLYYYSIRNLLIHVYNTFVFDKNGYLLVENLAHVYIKIVLPTLHKQTTIMYR